MVRRSTWCIRLVLGLGDQDPRRRRGRTFPADNPGDRNHPRHAGSGRMAGGNPACRHRHDRRRPVHRGVEACAEGRRRQALGDLKAKHRLQHRRNIRDPGRERVTADPVPEAGGAARRPRGIPHPRSRRAEACGPCSCGPCSCVSRPAAAGTYRPSAARSRYACA